MIRAWIDTTNERQIATNDVRPREDRWLPDPPERYRASVGRVQSVIRLALALTIVGTVLPSDLYLANGFLGSPIHALRDPMIINALVTLSVAFAAPVLPLALLAALLHIRYASHGHRQEPVG